MGNQEYMRFPIDEFRNRWEKAQEMIEKNNLKGLFITEGGNHTYFGGATRDSSFARPHVLLIPHHKQPIAIIQRFPAYDRKKEFWFEDVLVYDTMFGLPLKLVADTMNSVGMGEGRVGAELGYEQRLGCSHNDFVRLGELLPGVQFIDAAEIFWGIRMIKSIEEIARTRRACQITLQAYEALFPNLYRGISEREICSMFLKLQFELGGTAPWVLANSNPENYYQGGGGGPSNYRIQSGDQVWLDGGCQYREYRSDFCCAATVGPSSEQQKNMQHMLLDITNTLVRAVRPGIKACDLHALNHMEWEKRGIDYSRFNWAGGRIGHGMGWGSCSTEPPHIASYDKTILCPKMLITIEPAIYTEYGFYCAEMNLLITEDGCEILNDFNRDLRVISE